VLPLQAAAALEASHAQNTMLPGQDLTAGIVARLAEEVIKLDTEIADTETMIEDRFHRHRHAEVNLSMPGFGVILGAEFLAGICGLAPGPRDSGRMSGNFKRARRYHRRLLRTGYLAAQSAARTDPASRAYNDRER
jgi:transposase